MLSRHANAAEDDCPEEVQRLLRRLADRALAALPTEADAPAVRRASAELNGIYGIYEDRLDGCARDLHFPVGTDTLQGGVAAETITRLLEHRGCTVQTVTPRGSVD